MDTPNSNSSNNSNKKVTSKFIPKKLTAPRRWRKQPSKESFGSTASSEEHARGRSPHTRDDPLRSGSISTTQSNDGADQDRYESDDRSNLDATATSAAVAAAAAESDHDSSKTSSSFRPSVPSTHPSQIGYLTQSSPIIQAEHLPEAHSTDQEALESLSRPATSSAASGHSYEPARQPQNSTPGLQLPHDSSSRRSKSPAGRLKEAFRGKKNTSTLPSLGSQTDVVDHEPTAATPQRPTTAPSSQSSSIVTSRPDANDSRLVSHEPAPQQKRPPSIDTSARPHTPPSSESPAPVIVNTPPTPTESHLSRDRSSSSSSLPNPNVVVSPSGRMISHRRVRSGSAASIGPSKLSNITSAPLSPTPENAVPPTPGSGFFSSVLSAAQNAANTLSSSIVPANAASGGSKVTGHKIPRKAPPGDDDRIEVEPSAEQSKDSDMGTKEPAVKTLGMGDLSLSQLGIQEGASAGPTPTTSKFPEATTMGSRSRSGSAPTEPVNPPVNGDGPTENLYDSVVTTPPTSVYEGKTGLQRSSSIRSAISRRRKRGSTGGTGGTGNTIGVAIAAANSSVAHPTAAGSTPKLTGFAVASKKRNRDFHALFKSVPDDDYLIEDYSCALQREILAHGRLYVSEGHLCFSSNIFGWVTTLVMSFDEIVSVEKRSTALVFKNGLMITTLHAKHVFASFTSRDSTYDLIVNIWKLGHPSLRSSLNGVSLDETGGDKTEKVEDGEVVVASQSLSGSDMDDSEDGDDIYDEDQEDGDMPDATHLTDSSPAETDGEKAVTRKVSGAVNANGTAEKTDAAPAPGGAADFPGPATHAPTDCGDADTHYDVAVGDDIIPAPLGKVYNLMFGPASVAYMGKWLTVEQKCLDLQMEDKKGLSLDNKTRGYTYIKPLNASIGPKQTKCIVNETIENIDLEKSVNVQVSTQNPDVPSGNVFSVKTKYCLSWAENNATHVTVNCTTEWTGKSWIKGPIEKGVKDGQTQYCKDLFASLKASVSSRPRSATLNGGATKGKKKKGRGKMHMASKESLGSPAAAAASKAQDWGPLEPLHGILGPVVDIMKPILTGNVVYGLLVGLLVATWFNFGSHRQPRGVGYGRDLGFVGYPDRAVAYEEIWRREETELWDWLEERVGMQRMNEGAMPIRKRAVEPRTMEDKLREERMNEREVEEAIKVTEEKLQVLRSVMNRKINSKPSAQGKESVKIPAAET
ncbi:hypothetical protein F4809DRAFT_465762 [Biscogniauxia mediterranea]|nr:hypothetical protein F4809DRAFT_465762 [Biscogniauxia mediterranea]